MDQMASTFGAAGRALLLDCRSLAHQAVEIPAGLAIVVAGSGVHHELASSEYNKRRAECEEGVRILSSLRAGVRSLRDVEPEDEARFFAKLPPVVRKRCRHVVSENARVLEAVKALRAGDTARLKTLLAASHFSLRDDYEVSCPELDVLVDVALAHPACHGARLTGAGFGGSTVNLVDAGAVASFSESLAAGYRDRAGRAAEILVFEASAGAQMI
jgi:galactokinase